MVYAEDHHEIPLNILQGFKKDRLKSKSKMYIVQFFDKMNSWSALVDHWYLTVDTHAQDPGPVSHVIGS